MWKTAEQEAFTAIAESGLVRIVQFFFPGHRGERD